MCVNNNVKNLLYADYHDVVCVNILYKPLFWGCNQWWFVSEKCFFGLLNEDFLDNYVGGIAVAELCGRRGMDFFERCHGGCDAIGIGVGQYGGTGFNNFSPLRLGAQNDTGTAAKVCLFLKAAAVGEDEPRAVQCGEGLQIREGLHHSDTLQKYSKIHGINTMACSGVKRE